MSENAMADAYAWVHEPGRTFALRRGGEALWTYHLLTDRRKAFVHPLTTSNGTLLTCLEPWDHVWHRGLWFSWKYLNGVNYWEERNDPAAEPEGRTEFLDGERVTVDGARATVETRYACLPPGGAAVLEETRTLTAEFPRADGSYVMDWTHAFTATREPVVLDRTPIEAQTPWGGYAGFSWRAARSLGKFALRNSEGLRDQETHAACARWASLSGASDGGRDVIAGLAIFDHPRNPRHPSPWYTLMEPGFGFLNPAFLLREPYTLEPGRPLRLRYRVLVHDGAPDAQLFEQTWDAFART